jgi:hypothetical protein
VEPVVALSTDVVEEPVVEEPPTPESVLVVPVTSLVAPLPLPSPPAVVVLEPAPPIIDVPSAWFAGSLEHPTSARENR